MKITKKIIAKWALMYALGTWGFISFLYIAGEPIDGQMSIGRFCLLKFVGLVSLGLCVVSGIRLYRAGLMPVSDDDNDCKI